MCHEIFEARCALCSWQVMYVCILSESFVSLQERLCCLWTHQWLKKPFVHCEHCHPEYCTSQQLSGAVSPGYVHLCLDNLKKDQKSDDITIIIYSSWYDLYCNNEFQVYTIYCFCVCTIWKSFTVYAICSEVGFWGVIWAVISNIHDVVSPTVTENPFNRAT